MKKSLAIVLAVVLIIGVLSGCVQMEERMTFKADGTGIVTYQLAIEAGSLDMLSAMGGEEGDTDIFAEVKEEIKAAGGTCEEIKYSAGDYTYKGISVTITLDQLIESADSGSVEFVEGISVTQDERGYILTMSVDEHPDSTSVDMDEDMAQMLENVTYQRIEMDVEGELLTCEGNAVRQEDGIVIFEYGNKTRSIDTEQSTTDGVTALIEWKISETLAQKLSRVITGRPFDSTGNLGFTDIADSWAREELIYMNKHGVMSGTSDTTMAPNDTLTREQAMTMLHRMFSGHTYSIRTEDVPVSDVNTDRYSYEAIQWALENGYTSGVGEDSQGHIIFDPNGNLTHEQLITMAVRVCRDILFYDWIDFSYEDYNIEDSLSGVADYSRISDWAMESAAELRVNSNSAFIMSNEGEFSPKEISTRAYFAKVLVEIALQYDYWEN